MSRHFEELAWADTRLGELSLRRRLEPTRQVDVYEVKLGDEYLMSSLFTASEEALARLALARLSPRADAGARGDAGAHAHVAAGAGLDVVVGGLGLGYTARTVLEDARVTSLLVVDALPEVLQWHEQGLLPGSAELTADPRTRLVQGDFFAMAAGDGFDSASAGRRFDAVLVDIDHTPDHMLHPSHGSFYTPAGLRAMARFLRPGGVFGLWSDGPPMDAFTAVLDDVLDDVTAHVVDFPNPLTGGRSACTVYVGSVRQA